MLEISLTIIIKKFWIGKQRTNNFKIQIIGKNKNKIIF